MRTVHRADSGRWIIAGRGVSEEGSHQRQPSGRCRVSGVGVAKAASVMGCERVERVVEHHVVHSAAREERSTGLSRKSRLGALAARRPDLKIPGAAVASPAFVENALTELARVLASKYAAAFDARAHGIKLGEDMWRAGLALPRFPMELPPAPRSLFHKSMATEG